MGIIAAILSTWLVVQEYNKERFQSTHAGFATVSSKPEMEAVKVISRLCRSLSDNKWQRKELNESRFNIIIQNTTIYSTYTPDSQ